MPNQKHYPDLDVEYECRDTLCLACAEWRDSGRWVCESEDFVIRLWPYGDGKVDFNGHLFNRHSERRFKACRDALVSEARSLLARYSHDHS